MAYLSAQWALLPSHRGSAHPARYLCSLNHAAAGQQLLTWPAGHNWAYTARDDNIISYSTPPISACWFRTVYGIMPNTDNSGLHLPVR